jgi:hypothetical protein
VFLRLRNWLRGRPAVLSGSNDASGARPRSSSPRRTQWCGKARREDRVSVQRPAPSSPIETYARKLRARRKVRKPHVVKVAARIFRFRNAARRSTHGADAQTLLRLSGRTEPDNPYRHDQGGLAPERRAVRWRARRCRSHDQSSKRTLACRMGAVLGNLLCLISEDFCPGRIFRRTHPQNAAGRRLGHRIKKSEGVSEGGDTLTLSHFPLTCFYLPPATPLPC